MTDADKLRLEIARSIGKTMDYPNHQARADAILEVIGVPPEILSALKAGMKTAMPTALLRQIASQRLCGEMQEEARHDADFMEGYDCVVKLVRAMLSAAAPEKPE